MANLADIIPAFMIGPNGQRLTPEQIRERQQLAQSLMAQATDTSPNAGGVASILAKGVQGFAAGRSRNQADAASGANAKASSANVASMLAGLTGGSVAPVGQGATVASPMVAPVQSVASGGPVIAEGEIADYIRQSASARGIDPDIALRVAMSEGGVKDPTRQSEVVKNGVREASYGPFQLYMGGGLGNKALEAGIDPRDPNQWRQGVDFALDQAATGGWSPWYGAAKVGVGNRAGLDNARAIGFSKQVAQPAAAAIEAAAPSSGYVDPMVKVVSGTQQPTVQKAMVSAAPVQQAPMQSAQAAPAINSAIIEALSSPYASEQERSVAGLLLNQTFAQQEAAKKLAAAQAQQAAEWKRQDALRSQDRSFSLEDRDFNANRQDRRFETEDERANREYNYRVQNDSRNRQATINQQDRDYAYRVENDAANRQAPTGNMREYEAYRQDEISRGKAPLSRLEYEQSLRKSGANSTTLNVNGEKFDEKFGELDAKALSDTATAGQAAQRNLGRINQLGELLKSSPTGFEGAVAQRAGEWGIPTKGLDTLQAAQAAINSLVPEQRQPGSGPMSDADLALFKQSLPRIINQPGGNDLIINTMKSIAQYDAEGANIVQQLRSGKLDRAKAFEALQNRVNPLDSFKVPGAPAENPMPNQQTATGWKDLGNGVKIRPKGSN